MKHARPTVLYAAAVRDAAGVDARPGAVLIQDGHVVAAGEPDSLPAELVEQAEVIDRPNDLLLPAMVNAHTHLDLTPVGPQPYDPAAGFVGWVKMVRSKESEAKKQWQTALPQAIEASQASGVQAAGDIGHPYEDGPIKRAARFLGSSYRELFGLGPPFDEQARLNIADASWPFAIQPHSPYSAGPDLYRLAATSGRPVSTHLAEHQEELDFVAKLSGPMFDYVRSLGRWDDAFAEHYGKGLTPVQWMRPHLEAAAPDGGWLVAHCNYVSDEDITILADTNTSVAYCPIASEYFEHENHRYRDMLEAGVNVCLGTDSIVGTDPDDPQPLGLLSAMRRLYERDQTNPATLLAMATRHGAKALRLKSSIATLQPGAPANFACIPIDSGSAIDPLEQALTGQAPIEAISLWHPPKQ